MNYFYMKPDGEVGGPVDETALPGLLRSGAMKDRLVCREGADQWVEWNPPSAAAPPPLPTPEPQSVRIIDFDMPFGNLVMLLVKLVIASIPAALILAVVFAVMGGLFWLLKGAILND